MIVEISLLTVLGRRPLLAAALAVIMSIKNYSYF